MVASIHAQDEMIAASGLAACKSACIPIPFWMSTKQSVECSNGEMSFGVGLTSGRALKRKKKELGKAIDKSTKYEKKNCVLQSRSQTVTRDQSERLKWTTHLNAQITKSYRLSAASSGVGTAECSRSQRRGRHNPNP